MGLHQGLGVAWRNWGLFGFTAWFRASRLRNVNFGYIHSDAIKHVYLAIYIG